MNKRVRNILIIGVVAGLLISCAKAESPENVTEGYCIAESTNRTGDTGSTARTGYPSATPL